MTFKTDIKVYDRVRVLVRRAYNDYPEMFKDGVVARIDCSDDELPFAVTLDGEDNHAWYSGADVKAITVNAFDVLEAKQVWVMRRALAYYSAEMVTRGNAARAADAVDVAAVWDDELVMSRDALAALARIENKEGGK